MLIKKFSQIEKDDVFLCGGKATSLGFMIQNGIKIPNGFVITTESFDLYQTDKNNQPELINQIYQSFDLLKCEYAAVRSSGTCEDSTEFSFAGQFDTFLNVNRANLIEKIFECFEGLNSPRNLAYRAESGFDSSKIKVAVIVQSMIQSEVSGVAFTSHPVSKNKKQVLIEAGYGLGEAIVSGQISPDSYLVEKSDFNIIKVDISPQEKGLFLCTDLFKSTDNFNIWRDIPVSQQNLQKLSNLQTQELAQICTEIEKMYDFPCDIEWALAQNQFYILQSRPITA